MSSVVSTSVAPNASIVAQSQQQPAQRGDANSAGSTATAQTVTNGQAAVVSLTAETRNRAASYGEKREVDAAFDKEEIKEQNATKKADEEKGKAVDIAA